MIIVADSQPERAERRSRELTRAGYATAVFSIEDLETWITTSAASELAAVEAVIVNQAQLGVRLSADLRRLSQSPIVVINDATGIEATLKAFSWGADDVVSPLTDTREIVARIGARNRRLHACDKVAGVAGITVFYDGRDPEYHGTPLRLPRRERRILEFLVVNRPRRVTRSQIFNAVYGSFNGDFDENVIESHISKLRKKLRLMLNYDPIDSKRYLGYQFVLNSGEASGEVALDSNATDNSFNIAA